MTGTWKVPEIESMNRTFNEGTRFYNTTLTSASTV